MEPKPKLLLHICCAPDATSVFESLKPRFTITGFFYNPQIEPCGEYERRLADAHKVANSMGLELIEGVRDLNRWTVAVRGLETEPEKGRRCEACYLFRLEETARIASRDGFEYFTSTLSVSPHKSFDWLREMGQALSRKYGVKFLAEDFKKQDGFKRSLQWCERLDLYRQDYCGCLFSSEARKKIIAEQEEEFQRFSEELRRCRRCAEFLDPVVVFAGCSNRPVMIIGQAPGKHELEKSIPFSGPAGKKLWAWFGTLGYTEEEIRSRSYVTAVAKCWPGVGANGKDDAPPLAQQRKNCLSWLQQEFSHARPKLLILIGSLAAKTVLGKEAGMNLVGEEIERRIWNRKVRIVVLPHPSGLNRWPNIPANKSRFSKALELLATELKRVFP